MNFTLLRLHLHKAIRSCSYGLTDNDIRIIANEYANSIARAIIRKEEFNKQQEKRK